MAATIGVIGAVGSVASAGSGILGGILGRKSAADAQAQARQYEQQAQQFQQGVYNTAGTNIMPWISGGQEALGMFEGGLGLGSTGLTTPGGGGGGGPGSANLQAFWDQFTNTPYYTFPQQQFTAGAERAAGQLGIAQSQGDIANIGKMSGQYASGQWGNYMQALQGLAGMGLQGSQILGQIGTNVGQQVGQTATQLGGIAIGGAAQQQAATQQLMGGIGQLIGGVTGTSSGYGGGQGGTGQQGSQGLIGALSPWFNAMNYGSPASGSSGLSASGNPVMPGFITQQYPVGSVAPGGLVMQPPGGVNTTGFGVQPVPQS